MPLQKLVSYFLLLISLIAVQQYRCASSPDISVLENDAHVNASEISNQPIERHKRSRSRQKRHDDHEITSTTIAPQSEKLSEREIINKILLTDYDWRVRPVGENDSYGDTGGPVKVTVNIYLRSISKIDDVNMEYSAQFTFRETWIDRRLAYERLANQTTTVPKFIVLAPTDTKQQIWMPDTFFQNEKEARKHEIDKPNVLIRIHSDGNILYSVRLSMVLSCPMQLEYYPLDEQKCLIELGSYAYTTDDIEYQWKNETPVQEKPGLGKSLPSFQLQSVVVGECTSTTNTGQYSCLRTTLTLRREFSYYLLQLYIPSFMLVIVSWVSFWLDKDSVPARVTLGVTTLLTMTTQSSGINAKLPPVSYTKAIDVWIGVCLAFIFGALLEFALVNYAARKDIMRNVSGAMRRGRRPNVPTNAQPPTADASMENLNTDPQSSVPQQMMQSQQPFDDQCNYNTFMMVMSESNSATRASTSRASVATFGDRSVNRAANTGHCRVIRHASVPAHRSHAPVDGERESDSSSSFMWQQNPLLKTPPAVSRHHSNAISIPMNRVPYNNLGPPRMQHQQMQPNYHPYNSPIHQQTMPLIQQQPPPGLNGRIPSQQPNHQNPPAQHQQRHVRHQKRSCMDLWLSKYKERSKRIDVVSRLVFPVGFFIFNCVYWTVYML